MKNFEFVNLVSAHLASAVRSAKTIEGGCEHQRRQGNVDGSSQGSRTNIEDISKTLKKVAAYRRVTVESSKVLILKFHFQFSSLHHTILKPETHNSYCSPTLLTKPTHSTC